MTTRDYIGLGILTVMVCSWWLIMRKMPLD
jgi:hypothetical protein